VLARQRRVDLLERFEDPLEVLVGDTDTGVPDLDGDHLALVAGTDADPATARSELDGIRQQVEQHLPGPERVGLDGRQAGGEVYRDGQAPGRGLLTDHGDGRLDNLGHVDVDDLGAELVRLDLGEVEDVPDEGEQVASTGLDLGDVLRLLVGQWAVQLSRQDRRQPDDGVEGGAKLVAKVSELGCDGAAGRIRLAQH
jgi:hypothetical protein